MSQDDESFRRGCAILGGRVAARRAASRDSQRAGQHPGRAGGQGGAACAELCRPKWCSTGERLDRPVNYALVRIVPPPDVTIDPTKPPIVVVDPRAGHGPGIGGMKPESEIGVALRAGHAVYFIGFLPKPVPGADDRRRLPRRGGLPRGGREAPSRGRRQADRHRQLSGGLADHDDGGGPAGIGRGDHAGRHAALLLGRRSRQESDALPWRRARRHVADRARRRHGRRDFRRRRPRRQFRVAQSRQHPLDQALQRLFQGRFGDRALPRIRNLVGQPGAPERRRDAVDRRQPVRRQQARNRRDPDVRRRARRPAQHQVADRLLLLLGRQHHPAAAGAGLGPRSLRRRRARSSPTGRRSSTRCITASATSASSSRARWRRRSIANSSPAWR